MIERSSRSHRVAVLAFLWLAAKLGLMVVESLTMQLLGFGIFKSEVNLLNALDCIRLHPIASDCIRLHLIASDCI